MAARVYAWLSSPHFLVGAALARISLGAWAVFFYGIFWRDRHLLWGPEGIYPYERFVADGPFLNLFALSPSPLYVDALYVIGLAVAVLFTLGVRTRLMTALHWLLVWSFQTRNDFLGDGGDNMMRLALFFLVFVQAGARLSGDAARPRSRLQEALQPVASVVHNFGVLAILIQLVLLYTSTGLYKVMGELWQSGTALYYILRVDEFSWPGVAEHLYRSPYLVVGATYGTVLFEVTFGPLLLNRWTRLGAVIPAGILFHAAIGIVMGLPTFAWSMLSLYPLLVTDGEYQAAGGWLRRRLGLLVFYDGWCPFCRRSVAWLSRLDLFGLVRYRSFREPGVAGRYALDPRQVERRIQSLSPSGRRREGIDVMVAIASRSPLLWPLLVLLVAARAVAGQWVYDQVAARRLILIPGGCDVHCAPFRGPAEGA